MILFTYTDRSFGPKARPTADQVLFMYEATTITEADKAFQDHTGLNPLDRTIWVRVEPKEKSHGEETEDRSSTR
jgi:hypothetical protein